MRSPAARRAFELRQPTGEEMWEWNRAHVEDLVLPVWVRTNATEFVPLELVEVLSTISAPERQDVVAAHIEAIGDLVDHLRSCAALLDRAAGVEPDPQASEVPGCPACLTDPDDHHESLAAGVAALTGELVDAMRADLATVSTTW